MSTKELIQEYGQIMGINDKIYDSELIESTKEFDFLKVEEKLGFPLHEDLKDYLNSSYGINIEGIILPNQIQPTDKWGSWFEFEEQNDKISVSLKSIENEKIDIESYIEKGFKEWTGGYDFGRRMNIGSLFDSRGDILLVFNNDTGKVEWIDCEWGCFGNLEEDPNGVLVNSIYELIVVS